MIIMDLDPGEDVRWATVIAAARGDRERLAAAGWPAFVKTSGGKGLHVVAPLKPKADWPAVKAFTKAIADAMAATARTATSRPSKSKRHGKIHRLSAQPARRDGRRGLFDARPSGRAGVDAAGLGRTRPGIGPAYFTVDNMPTRLAALRSDPWADFRAASVPLAGPGPAL